MSHKKLYFLDTNVLVYDPKALFNFPEEHIGISIIVLEELDRLKIETNERGSAAREIIRRLDQLAQQGSLRDGIRLENGSHFEVFFMHQERTTLPAPLADEPDNHLLMTALALSQKGYDVFFVSKDLNARVKANVLGLKTQDYVKDTVSKDQLYRGWRQVMIPSIELKRPTPHALSMLEKEQDLNINEFIQLQAPNSPDHYKIFRYLGGSAFKEVVMPQLRWPLETRNPQQLMALDLLFDPTIQLVNLVGPAGTGKTFLALWAGLYQVLMQELYGKMLISRPVIPLGPDIGYLPGTIQEKLHSWMQPMYDTMDFITHSVNNIPRAIHFAEEERSSGYRKHRQGQREHQHHERYDRQQRHHSGRGGGVHHYQHDRRPVSPGFLGSLDQLINEGKVSLEAITYMRGRSIPFQYILIDESQNLTPHEVKTLISRVGEGSKIILLGDPFQIDALYLDFSSNGLVVSTSKFKDQSIFGTVFLHSSERSELSKLVNELM